jgi:hypothetical protein
MKTTKENNRRKFLLAAGLGSAGVAAAVVAKGTRPAGAAAAESAKQPSGYHVSDHILKYYKTTEV